MKGKPATPKNWRPAFRKWASTELPECSFRMLLYDDALLPAAIGATACNRNGSILVILPDTAELESVSAGLADILTILGDTRLLIPMPETSPSRKMWIPENEAGRCAALDAALNGTPSIFLATPQVLLATALAPKDFKKNCLTLKKGDSIQPAKLAEKLVEMDYDNELEVREPGEFSRRGGIFDVYSPLYDSPVRIEFWGDEIDSLRFFMPNTQRSFKEADELRITPRGTAVLDATQNTALVKDFFPKNIQTVLVDKSRIKAHILSYMDEQDERRWDNLTASFTNTVEMEVTPVQEYNDELPAARLQAVSLAAEMADTIPELGDGAALWHWRQLRDSIKRWSDAGHAVVACCRESGEVQRFKELIQEDPEAAKLPVIIEHQPLSQGLLIPEANLVLLSSRELFGRKIRPPRKKVIDYRHDDSIKEAMDIEEGSFVVHVSHGIARFHGVKLLENAGELQEVMELEFDDEVRLYVPLEQSFLVSRYLGAGKAQPHLSKMGGTSWKNAKTNAAGAAWDLAAELIKIEALRQNSTGHSMPPSVEWEQSFANSFPYRETADQEAAIKTVLADMENNTPMDRLLCGDVGYGKTEVAIRAAMRAVLNGKQAAVLVPTTILAQQHYQTFKERMAEYPVSIDMISRFRTAGETREILRKTAAGEIDILIGTHRIIQKDVHFRSLGLLVIDEEQRFGVKHKQMLKSMRADVDILTMTATPIPRTLYFSLSGIRNLSTIMTAPVNRLPVTTIVANYDANLIKLALRRELERKGQVFFLHNRVKSIFSMMELLQKLVPDARCAAAHGQMNENELETVMDKFIRHEIDILVCTTIIESGVDIPNVNTIIIDRADRFGLSELYQLRGRVGRHNRQAYAYMLLPPMGTLAENARERLAAIRRYTHLGAGFKLAMRDLEIRGAGNILGTEQSGHIAAVGFDLYSKLLKEAVNGLTKSAPKEKPQTQLNLDLIAFALEATRGKTPIGLHPDYIPDMNTRIEAYKKINALKSQNELDEYAEELEDRFGKIPQITQDLLEYHRLRITAAECNVVSVSILNGKMLVETTKGLIRNSSRQIPDSSANTGREQITEAIAFLNKNFRDKTR